MKQTLAILLILIAVGCSTAPNRNVAVGPLPPVPDVDGCHWTVATKNDGCDGQMHYMSALSSQFQFDECDCAPLTYILEIISIDGDVMTAELSEATAGFITYVTIENGIGISVHECEYDLYVTTMYFMDNPVEDYCTGDVWTYMQIY